MGVIKFFSSSSFDSSKECSSQSSGIEYSPSPKLENYTIIKSEQVGDNLVVFINYKDVTNYEGNKLLVYKNCTIQELIQQELIDPHFSDNKNMLSPIARFEPTDLGWELAILVASY
jgi:hypothetical protein